MIRCPRCGTRTEYSRENKWRPFCSERCRMIDLGRWAAEAYGLPEQDGPSSKPPES
ncbi:MAG TPA: DNA gyrase inhibitor YacG [Burkholderiales bacterium]|nr:DNA gyrase inhibitor YacG [Burkholderiales bacterium]